LAILKKASLTAENAACVPECNSGTSAEKMVAYGHKIQENSACSVCMECSLKAAFLSSFSGV